MNAIEADAYRHGFMSAMQSFEAGQHIDLTRVEELVNACLSQAPSKEQTQVHYRDTEGNLLKTTTMQITSQAKAARALIGFVHGVENVRRVLAQKGITLSIEKTGETQ